MHVTLKRRLIALGTVSLCLGLGFAACSTPDAEHAGAGGGEAGPGGGAGTGGWKTTGGDSGTGGVSATGGTGGQLGVPGADWELVPGSEFSQPHCYYYEAKAGSLTFAPVKWQSCGADCEWLDPKQGYSVAHAFAGAASVSGGKAYLRLTVVTEDVVPWKDVVSRVVRLEDGATVAALLERVGPPDGSNTCSLSFNRQTATGMALLASSKQLFGFAYPVATGVWSWAQPAEAIGSEPPIRSLFDTEQAWFGVGQGGVYALLDPKSSAWTALEAPSDSMFGGGEGDLALWTEWSTDRIRGWAPDGEGVRTVVKSAPSKTCLVRPSAEHIIGVALDADCATAKTTGIRFWHAPRTAGAAGAVTELKPISSQAYFPPAFGLRTFGDYAGVLVFDEPPGSSPGGCLIAAQLSTGKAWRVPAEPGYVVQQGSWAFDADWLYYGETLPGAHDYELHRVRRIRLSALDNLGEPL